jgi:fructose-specific component phosphotransferase system IIB-like protein
LIDLTFALPEFFGSLEQKYKESPWARRSEKETPDKATVSVVMGEGDANRIVMVTGKMMLFECERGVANPSLAVKQAIALTGSASG